MLPEPIRLVAIIEFAGVEEQLLELLSITKQAACFAIPLASEHLRKDLFVAFAFLDLAVASLNPGLHL